MVDHRKIQDKWQRKWKKEKIFEVNVDNKKKKFFINVPYPYISGSLHIGHGRVVTETDVYARYLRMQGMNVLYPIAFHISGTPVLGISLAIKNGDQKKIELYKVIFLGMVACSPKTDLFTMLGFGVNTYNPWHKE